MAGELSALEFGRPGRRIGRPFTVASRTSGPARPMPASTQAKSIHWPWPVRLRATSPASTADAIM